MDYTECTFGSGCKNAPNSTRGLCRKHQKSCKVDGTLENYPMRRKFRSPDTYTKTPITKVCDVEDCTRLCRSNVGAHCEMHEARKRNRGTTDPSERQRFRNQALIGEDLRCTKCDVVKPVTEFGKRKGPTGNPLIDRTCKDCRTEYSRLRREENLSDPNLFVGDKVCRRCKETKAKTEFDISSQYSGGLNVNCKRCRKDLYLIKTYDITLQVYEEMFEEQNGTCAICKEPENRMAFNTSTVRLLAVDHCHTTGSVRRLLCSSCNVGLGYFKDNPKLLEAAAAYLRRH